MEEMMNLDQSTQQMARQAEVIRVLVKDISDEQAHWKPSPDEWSVLEVINHLFDEESEDFRAHLDLILHHPDKPWPEIAPQEWVTERRYNERAIAKLLNNFLDARRDSLAWLKGLASPNWEAAYEGPFGPITAGDMLASWVAHDLLHMRQLVELQRAYLVRLAHPYKVNYAGPW
jgi:cytochrome P450